MLILFVFIIFSILLQWISLIILLKFKFVVKYPLFKVGSGEIMQSEDDQWENVTSGKEAGPHVAPEKQISVRRKCSIICPIYSVS